MKITLETTGPDDQHAAKCALLGVEMWAAICQYHDELREACILYKDKDRAALLLSWHEHFSRDVYDPIMQALDALDGVTK